MDMKLLNAYMNHGRWLIGCPRCGAALEAEEKGVVCPVCWPAMRAVLYQPVENGLLRKVHDMQTIAETRELARNKKEIWIPIFPDERHEIEEILRCRPLPQNMNWIPSETLDDLRSQNEAHGDPLPKRMKARK